MENEEIMSFLDEDGNKIDFELEAKIYLEEKEYLILSPVDAADDSEDAYTFRVDDEDGKTVYNFVEDEEEYEAVKKEYKKLLDDNK